jgi:PAS domain S-box-containing protein
VKKLPEERSFDSPKGPAAEASASLPDADLFVVEGQAEPGVPLTPGDPPSDLPAAREKPPGGAEPFRSLFAAVATGIAISTPRGQFLYANPAYCRMLGYAEDELRALNFAALVHPDDLHLTSQLRAELLGGQRESFFVEKRYRKKSGDVLWTRHSVSAMHAPGGEVTTLMVIAEDITERKLAEDALRHSEERLRLITNLVPHGIFAKDSAGRHIFANPALAELSGLSVAEILGKDDFDLVANKAQAEAYRADDLAVIRSGRKMVISEEPRTDLNGRTRLLQTIKVPYTVPETGESAVLGVCLDITDRKQAEEALRRQQTELQALFDLMPAMVCFKDTKNVFRRVNRRLAESAGRPIAEIEGKPVADFFPLDADKYYRDDLEVIRTGKAKLGIVETLQGADGKRLWVQTDKVPVCDQDEKVTGIVALVQDITQRKQAEEDSVRALALLRATLDSTADGILAVGLDRRVLSYNETFKQMSRIPAEALSAPDGGLAIQSILDQLRPADPFSARVRHLYDHPLEESFDSLHFKDDRVFECYSRPMLVAGSPHGRVWSFRDVTERKRLEQQFLRAQRMESIGTVAGGVAHDLNNILAPIMMSIDILKATTQDPEARENLETIGISAKRGADIVRQVLSFARGLEGQRIEVQLKHLAKDLEIMVRDTFPKDIRSQFSVPDDLWMIRGDPTQVYQILLNLCVNARDAMPNGGQLTIGVENAELDEAFVAMNPRAKPGRYVKISVTDEGTGIPPDVIGKIFEPFFTTKELNQGTGLGLSTVLAIVKGHDGIVTVSSEPGQGATFRVYLPALGAASPELRKPGGQPNLPRGKGETILVIDDEASLLTITSKTLQAFGYRVLTARNGAEGVALYAERQEEIAMVLTDMMMPGIDGPSVVRLLTQANPAVKIVAASGLGAKGGESRLLAAGVKHFLTKPYPAAVLLKTIRATLDGA